MKLIIQYKPESYSSFMDHDAPVLAHPLQVAPLLARLDECRRREPDVEWRLILRHEEEIQTYQLPTHLLKLEALARVAAMQSEDGNWNYAPYMHGYANGLILALAIMTGQEAKFLEAPAQWIGDKHERAATYPK